MNARRARAHAPRPATPDLPRLSRIPSDHQPQPTAGAVGTLHRPDERASEPSHSLVIERVFSRLSADAVSAKQSMGHLFTIVRFYWVLQSSTGFYQVRSFRFSAPVEPLQNLVEPPI